MQSPEGNIFAKLRVLTYCLMGVGFFVLIARYGGVINHFLYQVNMLMLNLIPNLLLLGVLVLCGYLIYEEIKKWWE